MNDKDKKKLENYKNRVKRQNEAAKNNWDRVSVSLPKGTKERIAEKGESINGLINRLVLDYLEK